MKKRRTIWVLITLVWVSFIFYNSSQNNNVSNERSKNIISEIKKAIFELKGIYNQENIKNPSINDKGNNSNDVKKENNEESNIKNSERACKYFCVN